MSQRTSDSVSNLKHFLKEPTFSTEREMMMEHWLLHEIYKEFASLGQPPLIYRTEYDRGGFDIAIGHYQHYREFQLKVKAKGSTTSKWDIHRILLLPTIDPNLWHYLGFGHGGLTAGRMGGVILMEVEIDKHGQLQVELYYCDIFTLAFQTMRAGKNDKEAQKLYRKLQSECKLSTRTDKVALRQSCFLRVNSMYSLLRLAGFVSVDPDANSLGELIRSNFNKRLQPGYFEKVNAYVSPLLKTG